MNNKIVKFFHQPKKVAAVAILLAVVIGFFGYTKIHQAPVYKFAVAGPGIIISMNAGAVQNLNLGFLSGGRIKSVSVKTGEVVKKGETLAALDAGNASGQVSVAEAAYENAEANYQKVINGATGAAIDVAKAAVNSAQVNADQVKKQQDLLVANSYTNLLNSTVTALSTSLNSDANAISAPEITGIYTGDQTGRIIFDVHGQTSGYFVLSGILSGTGNVSSVSPQALGDSGLNILFSSNFNYDGTQWSIDIPNKNAPNYLANYNAYQSAQQAQTQAEASAQASLDQANATLTQVATAARPEDVASAKAGVDSAYGALQIAQAAYANTVITAPEDGTVTAVSIAEGQIAAPNAPAIQISAKATSEDVPVMAPLSSIISDGNLYYVDKKAGDGVVRVAVTLGAQDSSNAEILSGISAGDKVAIH